MEPWMPAEALKACGQLDADDSFPAKMGPDGLRSMSRGVNFADFPDKASVLWNSMIHPLTRLAISAVYWFGSIPHRVSAML
jgi:hypothetical protein